MGHLGFVARSDWRYLPSHARVGDDSVRELRRDVPGDGEPAGQEAPDTGNYYMQGSARGEPAGVWFGPGAGTLGFRPGEAVMPEAMELVYGRLVHPGTGEALGSRPRTYASHEERVERLLASEPEASPERRAEITFQARSKQREACHYYDLTYSPEKSWSVLYAGLRQAGLDAEAEQLWSCLLEGYRAGLEHAMDQACYARVGRHSGRLAERTSGRWEKASEWTSTLWRHHTSRDGDPQLHIHGAVLNRVRLSDGRWMALDGTAVKNVRREAAAVMSRISESLATERLGVRFRTREDGLGREIAGVDDTLIALFSSRRRAIEGRTEEIVAAFQDQYGREPSRYELRLFSEQATLQTRARKSAHAPTGPELVAQWEREVRDRLGSSLADAPEAAGVLDRSNPEAAPGEVDVQRAIHAPGLEVQPDPNPSAPDRWLDEAERAKVVAQALATVAGKAAVWRRAEVAGAIDAHLPDDVLARVPAGQQAQLLADLTDQALATTDSVRLTTAPLANPPASWRRGDDGRGLHEPPAGYDRYSSVQTLAREERLVTAAADLGAAVADADRVEAQLDATSLRADQRAVVRATLTSGRRADVLVGPAGAGKSYTVAELTRLWTENVVIDDGVPPRVLGLAPSQAAVRVLIGDGLDRAMNIQQFIRARDGVRFGLCVDEGVRDLVRLRRGDLVVLDEASMASSGEVEQVMDAVAGAGAKLVLAGDDRQLGAVEGGGAFALLVERSRPVRLEQVVRFGQAWEQDASLRLRAGDATVIGEYARRGRIAAGDQASMLADAQRSYLADHLTGRDALILTGTSEQAAEVASHVRAQLVAAGRVEADGVALHDANCAGRGDLVQTRENDRRLSDGAGGWVANRDVFEVDARTSDGGLTVRRVLGRTDTGDRRLGEPVDLPRGYVGEHVELAYASTVHGAQGRTVDTCYPLVDPAMGPEALYVAMTRARERTLVHVVLDDQPPAPLGAQDVAASVTTPESVLAGIIERHRPASSATQVLAEEVDARESLARLAPEWLDLVTTDAHARHRELLQDLLTPQQWTRLQADPAAGPLLRAIRAAEVAGAPVDRLLDAVVAGRELDSAGSIGQVLHHRLTGVHLDTPGADDLDHDASYLARTPELTDLNLSAYARELARAMDTRVEVLGERLTDSPPAWLEPLGPVPDDPAERVEWTRRAGIVAGYREEHGYRHDRDAIGSAPHAGAADARRGWLVAWHALGRPDEQRELAAARDGDLFNRLQTWRRREAVAPPNVDEQLTTANRRHIAADREARLLQAEIDTDHAAGHDVARKQTQRDAFTAAAARHRADADALEDAATERSAWYEATAADRRAADLAYRELTRRLDRLPPDTDRPEPEREDRPESGDRPDRSSRERGGRTTETLQRIHETRHEHEREDRTWETLEPEREDPGEIERDL